MALACRKRSSAGGSPWPRTAALFLCCAISLSLAYEPGFKRLPSLAAAQDPAHAAASANAGEDVRAGSSAESRKADRAGSAEQAGASTGANATDLQHCDDGSFSAAGTCSAASPPHPSQPPPPPPAWSMLSLTSGITSRIYDPFPDARTLVPGSPPYLALFARESETYNSLVLSPIFPSSIISPLPRFLRTWLRNYLAGIVVYFLGSGLWALSIYVLFRRSLFPNPEVVPSAEAMWKQIWVSMAAMPLYCLLPTLSEWMVEEGWTRCYSQLAEVSSASYVGWLVAYVAIVEFGIYWAHRGLHDVKFLYRHLHATHHVYNKQNTLSPFAGLAFHPLDGIIQALPHVVALFLVPTHFLTHLLLLFVEGVWTTNIHDNLHGNVFPVMGAGYHTIHHTTYKHNYGHYTVAMDWLFGTLYTPEEYCQQQEKRSANGQKSKAM